MVTVTVLQMVFIILGCLVAGSFVGIMATALLAGTDGDDDDYMDDGGYNDKDI